jgi:formimidoylglutamate deiminase
VTPASLKEMLQALPRLGLASCPIHIHVAEQEKEVTDCLAWSGKRPIAWLMANTPADARWCLIHATHMSPQEQQDLIRTGATVGLCPSTEANLGDGVFPAEPYLKADGRFGIGSDSNCCVSPFEELRLMEYAQRLTLRRRAVLCSEATPSVGRTLYAAAAKHGAKALGLRSGALAAGWRADLLALSTDNAMLAGKEGDRILDTMIFGSSPPHISDVFVEGKRVVAKGKHPNEDESEADLDHVMEQICRAI